MGARMLDKLAAILISTTVLYSVGAGGAFAQATPAPTAPATPAAPSTPTAGATGGCFVAPAALSAADVSAFLSAPDALLTNFPSAGLPLANRVRSLAGTSADTLAAMVGLLPRANPSQVAAIGAGLARAARACAAVNPEYAAQIQDAVAGTNNSAFETAFLGATSETQTAALGAAGAGAAGAGAPGAGAIGGGGTPGGGVNGGAGAGAGTAPGNSAFSAGASSRFFASSGAGSSTTIVVSPNGSQ